MNAEQILKLIDAGYTKSEIDAMAAETKEQPAKPEQSEAPVVDDKTKEQPAKPEQSEASVVDDKTEKRLEKIETILSQIAANGIANSSAPEQHEKRNVVAEMLEHL